MRTFGSYLLRLFGIWITWLFLALDAIGLAAFVLTIFKPSFTLPAWVAWLFVVITITGFLAANFKLYADQESEKQLLKNRIAQLEVTKASLRLEVIGCDFNAAYRGAHKPFPDVKVNQHAYTKSGLPGWGSVWVQFRATNIGWEEGELECELDDSGTNLPTLFVLDANERGRFLRHSTSVPARDERRIDWYLYVRIADQYQELSLFAAALRSLLIK